MDAEEKFEGLKEHYFQALKPLFLPDLPIRGDMVLFFASLLRVLGMEDGGWDPYAESRRTLIDLDHLMKIDWPTERFTEPDKSLFRLGLLMYCHVVEMDAPYEVITNLLRFRLGKGYSPNPYFDFLTENEKKNFRKQGIRTGRKIELIQALSKEAGLTVGTVFDEFYNNRLRNAVQHSDFILTDEEFRSRADLSGIKAFEISYSELNDILTKAKAFIAAYFQIEFHARDIWGGVRGKALPYDSHYKGLLECLADDDGLLCGFAIHWPNNSASTYRRTEKAVEMLNLSVSPSRADLETFVGLYASKPGTFGPLVEHDQSPIYTPLDKSDVRPEWPDEKCGLASKDSGNE